MKRTRKLWITLIAVFVLISLFTIPDFAVTEAEVQAQVDAVGRDTVTGNLLYGFCAPSAF